MSTIDPQPQKQPSDLIPDISGRAYSILTIGFIAFFWLWSVAGLGGTIEAFALVFAILVVTKRYKFTTLPVVEVIPATVPATPDFEQWEREL